MSENSSVRRAKLEASIAKHRQETMADMDRLMEDFENENKPFHETFRILEAINQPDERSKLVFEAGYAANKKELTRVRDDAVAGLDAMEQQMRADFEKGEKFLLDKGESSNTVRLLVQQNYCVRDYMVNPPPPAEDDVE